METMAWRFTGRLGVVVHGPQSPTNLEWQTFLKEAAEHGTRHEGRVLVVSHGGGPDGQQRKQLTVAVRAAPAPTVIMTNSPIIRGITTALAFFNRNMKSVGLAENDAAFEFLKLTADERILAQTTRRELEARLGLS